jgi:hypothetical protein
MPDDGDMRAALAGGGRESGQEADATAEDKEGKQDENA